MIACSAPLSVSLCHRLSCGRGSLQPCVHGNGPSCGCLYTRVPTSSVHATDLEHAKVMATTLLPLWTSTYRSGVHVLGNEQIVLVNERPLCSKLMDVLLDDANWEFVGTVAYTASSVPDNFVPVRSSGCVLRRHADERWLPCCANSHL